MSIMSDGRRLLRKVLPAAQAELALKGRNNLSPVSARGSATFPYFTSANLDALMIYRNGNGWTADLVFKNIPAHIGNSMGTPDSEPLASYDAALARGITLIVNVLSNESVH
jgi:hypothetical protein